MDKEKHENSAIVGGFPVCTQSRQCPRGRGLDLAVAIDSSETLTLVYCVPVRFP